jgi:snapalysin
MSVGRITRFALAATVAALGLVGVQLSPASAAPAAPAAARVVYYNADAAGVWKPNVVEAVQIWNTTVKNVRLVEGRPAAMTIYASNGWPYAVPTSLGRGRIYLGEEAVRLGHGRTRITAHEIGHILGLPDRRTGRCSDLMSGSSAPATCRNATPSAREAAEVEANFVNGFARAGTLQPSVW